MEGKWVHGFEMLLHVLPCSQAFYCEQGLFFPQSLSFQIAGKCYNFLNKIDIFLTAYSGILEVFLQSLCCEHFFPFDGIVQLLSSSFGAIWNLLFSMLIFRSNIKHVFSLWSQLIYYLWTTSLAVHIWFINTVLIQQGTSLTQKPQVLRKVQKLLPVLPLVTRV